MTPPDLEELRNWCLNGDEPSDGIEPSLMLEVPALIDEIYRLRAEVERLRAERKRPNRETCEHSYFETVCDACGIPVHET